MRQLEWRAWYTEYAKHRLQRCSGMGRTMVIPSAYDQAGTALPSSLDHIGLPQTFVRIVEAGSLSAAATLLGTPTQPTVSRRLQALERSLGLPLLQRTTHTMKLTEDGERCFERAKALLASLEAFASDMRGDRDQPDGRAAWSFRTRSASTPAGQSAGRLPAPLPARLGRVAAARQAAELHRRRHHCAILVGAVADPAVVAIRLTEVPRIVAAAPSVVGPGSAAGSSIGPGGPALARAAHLLPRHDRADPRVGGVNGSSSRSARA